MRESEKIKAEETTDGVLLYVAYCTDCRREIERIPNGAFAEAHARRHAEKHKHRVILGIVFNGGN